MSILEDFIRERRAAGGHDEYVTWHDFLDVAEYFNRRMNEMATQADIDALTSELNTVADDLKSAQAALQAEIDQLANANPALDISALKAAADALDPLAQKLGGLTPTPPAPTPSPTPAPAPSGAQTATISTDDAGSGSVTLSGVTDQSQVTNVAASAGTATLSGGNGSPVVINLVSAPPLSSVTVSYTIVAPTPAPEPAPEPPPSPSPAPAQQGKTVYLHDGDPSQIDEAIWPPSGEVTDDPSISPDRPLYFYAGDSNPGDKNGDGLGGVWHAYAGATKAAPTS